jgi:hypothetical protein
MKLEGNHLFTYRMELLAGLVVLIATWLWGDIGLLGMAIFFGALVLTHRQPDEREMILHYKISALETGAIGAIMGAIYVFAPTYNWFHGLVGFSMVSRGLIGWVTFARE